MIQVNKKKYTKMKTKHILILIVFALLSQPVLSQNRKIKAGNRHFYKYNYSQAIKYYEPVKEKGIDLERNLATSYVMTESYDKALEVYESIMKHPERNFSDVWNYFLVLQRKGMYEKAVGQVQTMNQLNPEDSRVQSYLEAGHYYKNLLEAKPAFEVKNLSMNSPQQDFSTALYKGNVVYASTRNKAGVTKRTWAGNNLRYLNLYISEIDENNDIQKGKPFNKKFNKKYHDGPVSFTADGKLMAMTRNNYDSKSSDGTRNLQIFLSEYINNEWTEPVAFPYNNPEYSVGQTNLSPDGKYLYFVSDMPGGKGGTDIYRIDRKADGSWGVIQNLESINTEGNEMFPVYHPDGLLFFSSNGHPGLGGLDVFVSPVAGNSFGTPKNMGIPVNSPDDDFALVLNQDQKFGYLSSNRAGGEGSDDIYAVNVLEPVKFEKRIKGVTKDPENKIIANTEVSLILNDKTIEKVMSDDQGNFEFYVNQETLYHLVGKKDGYHDGLNKANTDVPEEIIYADLILSQQADFALKIIVQDAKTGNPVSGARIFMKDNLTFEESAVYTAEDGSYITKLPSVGLNDKISYNLKIDKLGYVSKTSSYYQVIDRPGEYVLIEKLDPIEGVGTKIQINPIYFDFDKHNIRPDAAAELDKIVQIMNEYPDMVIELSSHTDCRGSYDYNMALSERRAKSSAEYVRARISKPERIYGKGFGESKLVNNCDCEGDKVSGCSEDEHQMNRRTEFVIIKM